MDKGTTQPIESEDERLTPSVATPLVRLGVATWAVVVGHDRRVLAGHTLPGGHVALDDGGGAVHADHSAATRWYAAA